MELDVVGLVTWLVVAAALITIPLVAANPEETQRRLGPRVMGLLERAATRLRPEEEPDPLAEALRAQLRREKLVSDVQRLRRLVANDMRMSATRQLGNRIAYASLVAELEALREAPPTYAWTDAGLAAAAAVPVPQWQDDPVLSAPIPRLPRDSGQRAPAVEVLELGPRRRTAHR